LWHYATNDTAAMVDDNGYFNEACDMLRTGDMVMANVETEGSPKAGIFLVSSSVNKTVDVSDLSAFGATNTD